MGVDMCNFVRRSEGGKKKSRLLNASHWTIREGEGEE